MMIFLGLIAAALLVIGANEDLLPLLLIGGGLVGFISSRAGR